MSLDLDRWDLVIGLEVHCELKTATKLFCGCLNRFGAEPNTNVCPICLGLPGSLPVLNRQAVELAMRIGAALDCDIRPSVFHRKNYFYPDMPKDFQTTQYDEPINVAGSLLLPSGDRITIERAHMEEDTGKSTHVGGGGRIGDATHSLVDYNRAGVPLVEIVSGPDLRSAEDARAYVAELRNILVAVGASDGKMEEGSMRVDANVSVKRRGTTTFGTRCEIKNLNSLRSLGRAIDHEAERQALLLDEGTAIVQETRHWDEGAGRTRAGRRKEEADDYRYFPEPDLVPLDPAADWVGAVRAALPVLPAVRRERLAVATGVDAFADAVVSAVGRDLDGLVLDAAAIAGAPAGTASPIAKVALNRAVNDLPLDGSVEVGPFGALVALEVAGSVTATQAKVVLDRLVADGGTGDPAAIAAELGFEALGDDVLERALDELIAARPDDWASYVGGNDKVAGLFTGQIMKATQGKADGKAVAALLRSRRGAGA